jgi:hypothetical protein
MKLALCNWHYRAGARVLVQYPAEYQRWISGKNTDVALFWDASHGATPQVREDSAAPANSLRFLYPADGAMFVYDPSIPREIQQFSVDCIGGSGDRAALYCNSILVGETGRPFSWTVPVIRSSMTLAVVCGNERAEIRVEVQ